jgi:hypothetical protein
MMRSGNQVPAWVAIGIGVSLVFTAVVAAFAALGAISFFTHKNPKEYHAPSFYRSIRANCDDVFYCLNASSPNPTYISWNSPPFSEDSIFTQEFSDVGNAFDISNPETIRITRNGVYAFTVFTPVFSPLGPSEAAFVLTQNLLPVLESPAIGGFLGPIGPITLFMDGIGNISAAIYTYSSAGIYLTSGTDLRIAYKVSENVMITPGSYISGFRISDHSL